MFQVNEKLHMRRGLGQHLDASTGSRRRLRKAFNSGDARIHKCVKAVQNQTIHVGYRKNKYGFTEHASDMSLCAFLSNR